MQLQVNLLVHLDRQNSSRDLGLGVRIGGLRNYLGSTSKQVELSLRFQLDASSISLQTSVKKNIKFTRILETNLTGK